MAEHNSKTSDLTSGLPLHKWENLLAQLRLSEIVSIIVGVVLVLIQTGQSADSGDGSSTVRWLAAVAMTWLCVSRVIRFVLTASSRRIGRAFLAANLFVPTIWVFGLLLLRLPSSPADSQLANIWTPLALTTVAFVGVLMMCRTLAARTQNSAVLLVGSFFVVIAIGTLLLKLPVSRAASADVTNGESAGWVVALFTATSASCVTGLVLEPTGTYWSPFGHAVIFGLFQIGGLGILTFGAFIAVLSGRRGLQFREARTLRDMLDADSVQSSRRLLLTILLFTILVEVIGAMMMMGLWSHLPLRQQIWHAAFHSVSAFCNAGFSLHDDGFLNMGTRWQVWSPLSVLIILGGLGFPVVRDVCSLIWQKTVKRRCATPLFNRSGVAVKLTIHTKLVLWSTIGLLLFGALSWFVLESLHAPADSSVTKRVADSWFQSVTFRTAGFNTVDHEAMHPASKLLAIFLMFIGAAPGSTGGGVKTVVFALTVMNIWAVFRGRDRVEVFGRTVPTHQVSRALSMIAVGLAIVMATTGLLVIFERQPERFLDHLFEATSAFGTVGVSAGVTSELSMPSRILICLVMFLGRVGPITLMLALANPGEPTRYDYPEERVSLG